MRAGVEFREINSDVLLNYNERFGAISLDVSLGANRDGSDLFEHTISGIDVSGARSIQLVQWSITD